jgi:hypothetical protein
MKDFHIQLQLYFLRYINKNESKSLFSLKSLDGKKYQKKLKLFKKSKEKKCFSVTNEVYLEYCPCKQESKCPPI